MRDLHSNSRINAEWSDLEAGLFNLFTKSKEAKNIIFSKRLTIVEAMLDKMDELTINKDSQDVT